MSSYGWYKKVYDDLIIINLCRCFRLDAKNKELLFVGRICIVILVAISIAWIPIIQQMQGLILPREMEVMKIGK